MSLDYRLTLADGAPVEQVAARGWPDLDERPTGTVPLLSANLAGRYGFNVSIRAGQHGYVDAMSDDGQWEWEPGDYVNVAFHVDKSADFGILVINMLTVVRRLLTSGQEDAALVLNGDILILARFNGEVAKHNRETWWAFYPAADQLIPD